MPPRSAALTSSLLMLLVACGPPESALAPTDGGGGGGGLSTSEDAGTNGSDGGMAAVVQPIRSSLAVGDRHACAINEVGGLGCWGSNEYGQLGTGTNLGGGVEGLEQGVLSVAAGGDTTCAITTSGGLKCWGRNDMGQLGIDLQYGFERKPHDVKGRTQGVSMVAVGGDHVCAVQWGALKCWGRNSLGQLGLGYITLKAVGEPHPVVDMQSDVAMVTAGPFHTCALKTNGSAYCWGQDVGGSLGVEANSLSRFSGAGTWWYTATPGPVRGLPEPLVQLEARGSAHTCGVTRSGAALCWGRGTKGQLGNGADFDSRAPVQVQGLESGVRLLTSSDDVSCALTHAQGLVCWGNSREKLSPWSPPGFQHPLQEVLIASEGTSQWGPELLYRTPNGEVKTWKDGAAK